MITKKQWNAQLPPKPGRCAGYMIENFDNSDPEQIDRILDTVHMENKYYEAEDALMKKLGLTRADVSNLI